MSQGQPKDVISRRAIVSTAIAGTAMAAISLLLPPVGRAVERAAKQSDATKPTKLRFVKDESGISYADVKVRSSWSASNLKLCLIVVVAVLHVIDMSRPLTFFLARLCCCFVPTHTHTLTKL
jgi:hypothetical protein